MKYVCIVGASLIIAACQGVTQQDVQLKSPKDSVSYSIGLDMGKNIRRQMIDVDVNVLARGVKDAIDSVKPMMTEEQITTCMTNLQQQVMAKHETMQKEQGEKNLKQGEVFLAENKKKEGVITLPDGLQYKVITAGTGPKPKDTETVSVHYRGTLIDGTEFDSSIKRGKPAEFPVNGVIKGWTEALLLMPTGSKWELYIPPDLAYGSRGAGGVIAPNAVLIFEVELLAIK